MKPSITDRRAALAAAAILAIFACWSAQAAESWTLTSSIARAIEVAPETRLNAVTIQAQQAARQQAGAWPNPSIELRADNRISREFEDDGYDLTAISFTQPLSWGVSRARQTVAERELTVIENKARAEQLELERRVAIAFHELQRDQALLKLARQTLDESRRLLSPQQRRLEVGDISRREAMRMELFVSQAELALAEAEGRYSESRLTLAMLLALEPWQLGELPPLADIDTAPALYRLEAALSEHPLILASTAKAAVHEAGIELARAEARPGLSLTLFRERDVFAGREQTVNGGAINIELPLWDRRQGRRGELAAQALGERQQGMAVQRQLAISLHAAHEHLHHLIEQVRHQERMVLAPAREVYTLSERGYREGELDLINLIEARDTLTAAEVRQQELRAEAWITLAEVLHAAGVSIASFNPESYRSEEQES
jgi:cobalt-zinc-cadmium efflux system outer membrane protein